MNDQLLTRTNQIKDIGATYHSDLDFNEHVVIIVPKARILVGFLKRQNGPFKTPEAIKTVYIRIVMPVLEYGCHIWVPSSESQTKTFEGIQNIMLKYFKSNVG